MSYYEICEFLREDNTTLVWDNEQMVPFAYRDDQWVGFDDERSLKTKVSFVFLEICIMYLYFSSFSRILVISLPLYLCKKIPGSGVRPLKTVISSAASNPFLSDGTNSANVLNLNIIPDGLAQRRRLRRYHGLVHRHG